MTTNLPLTEPPLKDLAVVKLTIEVGTEDGRTYEDVKVIAGAESLVKIADMAGREAVRSVERQIAFQKERKT